MVKDTTTTENLEPGGTQNEAPAHTIAEEIDKSKKEFHQMEPVADPLLGTVVMDRFEVVGLIGTGGWSRVYKANELSSDRAASSDAAASPTSKDGKKTVALKVLHSHLLFDAESCQRFQREAESGASLSHPNICAIYDYNRLDTGQPFIAMEYLEGESLASVLRQQTKLSPPEALPIFIACAKGLQAAHAQNIIHRDIKPANIFITRVTDSSQAAAGSPGVKVLDFGMAKIMAEGQPDLTQTGTAFGTVHYMSPEQVSGHAIDARTDIYSLGCVMYEALSGHKVCTGKTSFEVMEQHLRETPRAFQSFEPDLNIPENLDHAVMKCLAKDPARRFASISELIVELENPDKKPEDDYRGVAGYMRKHAHLIITFIALAAMLLYLMFTKSGPPPPAQ